MILLCLISVLPGHVRAQADGIDFGKSELVEAKIELKSTTVNGPYVVIEYEIPFSGMVEIRLYDNEGHKVWQNQYAHRFGENRIVLKASKFNPGETYTYALNYKRDMVREQIIVPPLGFD